MERAGEGTALVLARAHANANALYALHGGTKCPHPLSASLRTLLAAGRAALVGHRQQDIPGIPTLLKFHKGITS